MLNISLHKNIARDIIFLYFIIHSMLTFLIFIFKNINILFSYSANVLKVSIPKYVLADEFKLKENNISGPWECQTHVM